MIDTDNIEEWADAPVLSTGPDGDEGDMAAAYYDSVRCAKVIYPGGRLAAEPRRCRRRPGHGPGNAYCRAHAAELVPPGGNDA